LPLPEKEHVVRAFVINLDRCPDRRAHMTAELARAGVEYEIISAVDGRDLDLHDPRLMDPAMLASIAHRPGSAGCALSHLRVLQRVLADGHSHALVLEDDIRLPAGLAEMVDALAPQLTGAEVALLNFESSGTSPCLMSRDPTVGLTPPWELALPLDVGRPVSGAAYVITREACERIADGMLPLRALSDDWAFYFREGMLDRVRCVVPMPVSKHPGFPSTIEYRPATSLRLRVRDMAARQHVPIILDVIAYRRQRLWRKQTRTEFVDRPFIEKPTRLGL
jgi:glycosyl transferase family 25